MVRVGRFPVWSIALAALMLLSVPALADVANPAQDESLAGEVNAPEGRFRSTWRVQCAGEAATRQCTVSLETVDRVVQGYTRKLEYPFRVVVDRAGRRIELPFKNPEVSAGRPVRLVIDSEVAAQARAGETLDDPALFGRLFAGDQLLVSTGTFADGPRVRSYLMLEGLQDAVKEAQAALAAGR